MAQPLTRDTLSETSNVLSPWPNVRFGVHEHSRDTQANEGDLLWYLIDFACSNIEDSGVGLRESFYLALRYCNTVSLIEIYSNRLTALFLSDGRADHIDV